MNTNTPPLSQLSRYELITQLGEGGMARVFLAISRGPIGFNKLMVVKQVRPELAADSEFLGMFLDEARIALALHHPNIVETYEIFEEDGRHLMAMEYLDGQTQADLLFRMGRDRMPLEEHIWVLTQVLAALHHAHELRAGNGQPLDIVHRDVSPSNVFLTYDGRVKLLDFGIAKASGAISTTARGTVKAKIGYGAPEQFLSSPIDRRADIFSVGVMLWEALAGCRRKIGETLAAMIEARVSGLEPGIRAVRPGVPASLAAICDRATAVRPEARYATAAELGRDLERWLTTRTRMVGARDLGALMNRHFAAERQARRLSIERQLGGSDSDPTRSLVIPTTTPVPPARRSTPTSARHVVTTPIASPRGGTPTAPRPAVSSPAPRPPAPVHAAAPTALGDQPFSTLIAVELETPLPDPLRRRRALLLGGSATLAIAAAATVLIMATGPAPAPDRLPGASGPVDVDRPPSARPAPSPAIEPAPGEPPRRESRPAVRRVARHDVVRPASLTPSGDGAAGSARSGSPSSSSSPSSLSAPVIRPRATGPASAAAAPVPSLRSPAMTTADRPAPRALVPGEQLPRPTRSRTPRRQLDEEDPYR